MSCLCPLRNVWSHSAWQGSATLAVVDFVDQDANTPATWEQSPMWSETDLYVLIQSHRSHPKTSHAEHCTGVTRRCMRSLSSVSITSWAHSFTTECRFPKSSPQGISGHSQVGPSVFCFISCSWLGQSVKPRKSDILTTCGAWWWFDSLSVWASEELSASQLVRIL